MCRIFNILISIIKVITPDSLCLPQSYRISVYIQLQASTDGARISCKRAESSSVINIHKQVKQINKYYKQRPLVTRRKRFCSSCIFITSVFVLSRCRKEAAAGGPDHGLLGHNYTKHFVIHKDKRKIKICKTHETVLVTTFYTHMQPNNFGN